MAAAYPDSDDVAARAATLGVTISADADVAAILASVLAEWHGAIGYAPFLAPGTATEKVFDRPFGSKTLFLATPLAALTSLEDDDVARTVDVDFFLEPYDRPSGSPATRIEFSGVMDGSRRKLAITGKWGWSLTVPDDVFEAHLARAFCVLAESQMLPGFGVSFAQGSLKVSGSEGDSQLSMWRRSWETAVARYRLTSLF